MSSLTSEASVVPQSTELLHRNALKAAVCAVCVETGYHVARNHAVETLTEMLQSFITQLCRSTKAYSEHSGRTEPVVTDVILALIGMGQRVNLLPAYARRANRIALPTPAPSIVPQEPKRLQVGTRRPHKPHIMDYMPPFPDPHTYIKSAAYKAPCQEYQTIREKAATQKVDVEKALTRFIAKTGDTENIFGDDPYAYPLIANKPKPLPYMEAILPKDQDTSSTIEEEDGKANSLRQGDEQQLPSKRPLERLDSATSSAVESITRADSSLQTLDALETDSLIDNPYLRPIKMPKLKTSSSKKYKF